MSVTAARMASDPAYEEAKRLARNPDAAVRAELAARDDLRPEILYYLAEDTAAEVRRKVATNAATPVQADMLLVRDHDEEVRADLAAKLASLLPDLPPDRRDALREQIEQMLDTLARDEAVRVRAAVAETLKDVPHAPAALVKRLAHDIEDAVASPVLRFSALLSEEDLIELVAHHREREALSSIAARDGVGERIADAIVATGRDGAVAALLANRSAQIREETLDLIVERAPAQPGWHAALVERPVLPAGAARKISSFIADALLKMLEQRPDLDADTRAAVAGAVRHRSAPAAPAPAKPESKPDSKPEPKAKAAEAPKAAAPNTAEEEVRRLAKAGKLDEEAVSDRLLVGDRVFVRLALAELAKIKPDVVDRILLARSPKGVVSLAWRAGVGMRCAVQLQMRMGGIAPKQLLQPRAGAWPLTPQEMSWHLEFFGAG
jgi:uncharacterized protein (DUF2336 family)